MKQKLLLLTFASPLIVMLVPIWENPAESSESGEKEVVVLLHGLARSNMAMWRLKQRLEEADFHVETIGYASLNRTSQQMIQEISQQINDCCRSINHRVHFVGHSLGGLLIRAYLVENRPDNLGRVVLIGTPNRGSEVADYANGRWWGHLAGPAALSLGTTKQSFPNTLPEPDYPVGVIAGISSSDNDELIPGLDDGLVSVESTKLDKMQDFTIVPSGHSMMRYNTEVADQTIHFLRMGQFNKSGTL
ncbi:MAG: alpha/beta hydrolase [Candidatus Thiodiazotropha sp. (ex. Lucinisca nassula)]|nr:alpha/beta hydrolase [Candidatus Thiodiazotropha sp. (ex. Lucinisca nassula)]